MKLSKYAFGDEGWGEGKICYPNCTTSRKQIFLNLLPYMTVLTLVVSSLFVLLLLSPSALWATPITSSIPLGFEPGAVATDSANNLIYVVDQENLQIRVIDGATGSLLPINFPLDSTLGVSYIAVDGERHRLFVDYYCSGCYGYIQVFDIDTQMEVSRIENSYGAGGMAINPDNGRVYIAMYHTVWVLYPNDAGGYYLGKTIEGLGDKAGDVAFDRLHQRLYVSIHHENEVAVVDTSTETLINTVPVLAGNPTTVAVNPNNRHVYVGQNLGNQISVVDGATETALPNIQLADGPILVGVDPTTARVFVGMRQAMSVGIVDGNTDTVLCPLIPINGLPTGLSVNTTDHCAYVGVLGQKSIFKVCGCATSINATIDIHPDTLNLKSKGKWMTCYIEIPDEYTSSVNDIDVDTLVLTIDGCNTDYCSILRANESPTEVGNYDNDEVLDLMIKFDRGAIQNMVNPGTAEITVSGFLTGGTEFQGTDIVLVIDKGNEHIDEGNPGSVEF